MLNYRLASQTTLIRFNKKQHGVVLIISLIMLLLLSLIGVTGVQSTSLEEKMAGNMRNRDLAFQAAEAALKEGEANVKNPLYSLPFNCVAGRFPPPNTGCNNSVPVWETANIWTGNAPNSVKVMGLTNLYGEPRYIIEDLGTVPNADDCDVPPTIGSPPTCPNHYYRVTARAVGGTADAEVMVQSIYQQ